MAEEFVIILPPHLSMDARRRLAEALVFEQEVLALLSELLGRELPAPHACIEEHRAVGTWDVHILRSWQAGDLALRATARPIEGAGGPFGEDIEFEVIEVPPLRFAAIASLDVRVGGSLRVTVAGCPPADLERIRASFGRHIRAILAALESGVVR